MTDRPDTAALTAAERNAQEAVRERGLCGAIGNGRVCIRDPHKGPHGFETMPDGTAADGTLGALRELTADLPDSTPIVVVIRKAHDVDHFYAAVAVESEQVDLLRDPVIVLTAPEPEDFDE